MLRDEREERDEASAAPAVRERFDERALPAGLDVPAVRDVWFERVVSPRAERRFAARRLSLRPAT